MNEHHPWCNYFMRPYDGCTMCVDLYNKYPLDGKTDDELIKEHFPDVVMRAGTGWTEERRIVYSNVPDLSHIKIVKLPTEIDPESIDTILDGMTAGELEALDQWILERNNTNSPTSETKK